MKCKHETETIIYEDKDYKVRVCDDCAVFYLFSKLRNSGRMYVGAGWIKIFLRIANRSKSKNYIRRIY